MSHTIFFTIVENFKFEIFVQKYSKSEITYFMPFIKIKSEGLIEMSLMLTFHKNKFIHVFSQYGSHNLFYFYKMNPIHFKELPNASKINNQLMKRIRELLRTGIKKITYSGFEPCHDSQ